MPLTFLGETHFQRCVAATLLFHTFASFTCEFVNYLILTSQKDPKASFDAISYICFALGYIYLMDAFRSKNVLQLKTYLAWLVFMVALYISLFIPVQLKVVETRSIVKTLNYVDFATYVVSMAVQLHFMRKAIAECEWKAFRITGADRVKQELWKTYQFYLVVLKLTGVLLIPQVLYLLTLKPLVFKYREELYSPLLLISCITVMSLTGCVFTGIVFTKRENKPGMIFYFVCLIEMFAAFAFYVWAMTVTRLLPVGFVGVVGLVWSLLLLFQSIRITLNFGKGLLDCFLEENSDFLRRFDLDDEIPPTDSQKNSFQLK